MDTESLLEEYGFSNYRCIEELTLDFDIIKSMYLSKSNSLKSLNGSFLNKKVHDYLEGLLIAGSLSVNTKECMFKGLNGYEEEQIILDSYIETSRKYVCKDGIRPLRIGIDNTTVIRKDRFRGKQYEARVLKDDNLLDYFIVITHDEEDILYNYWKDKTEISTIINLQHKILEGKVSNVVNNVLFFTKATNFLKDLVSIDCEDFKTLHTYIKELELNYKL